MPAHSPGGAMNTRVINLSEPRTHDAFPAYAAIYSAQAHNPFLLSPTAMRWNANIVLARLEDCRHFWLGQKKKLRCSLSELLEPLLRHHCGDEFIVVFGSHPWQCLLYLNYQYSHRGQGIYRLDSRIDRNIYHGLGWSDWFGVQDELADHWLAIGVRGFDAQGFRASQRRMQRFIERIGVARPGDMSAADANSITRRFGKWLGLAWRWSFTGSGELEHFPWLDIAPGQMPEVRRELEYPVNQWSLIEILLREDLARLGERLRHDDCVHINRMRWEILLFNERSIAVELSFRHPYALHRDAPDYATALYQARYLYDDLLRKLQAREHDLDLPENMPFLRWRIEILERVQLAPQLWELFDREIDRIDYRQIMSLQNKLPVAFECFQAEPSFYPERSFSRVAVGAGDSPALDHRPWSCAASNKPLFYLPTPQPIDDPSDSATPLRRIFLERNSSQWWLSAEGLQSIRDYFILESVDGRCSWVFRDQDGAWFKQGEYC